MWNKLSTREKVLLTLLFGGGIIFCMVYFIIVPQFKGYVQVKNELTENRAKLSRAQATAASLKGENDKLIKAKEDYAVKGKPFLSRMRDGSDVIFLGLISASERVDIIGIEPGDIIEKTHSLELPLKIDVQGDYLGLIEFCKDIDKQVKKSTNLAEIRSLNISSNQSSGSKSIGFNLGATPGTVKATIGIVMFSAKNPEEKLYLEEVSNWLMGCGNVFSPNFSVALYPELSGYLSSRSSASLPAGGQYTGSTNTQLLNSDPEYNLKK